MKAILISELTFSERSEILHFVGFGSKVSGGGVCSPPVLPAQEPPPASTDDMTVHRTREVKAPMSAPRTATTTARITIAAIPQAAATSKIAAPAVGRERNALHRVSMSGVVLSLVSRRR